MAAGSLSPVDRASRRGVARPEVAKTYCEFFAGVGLVDLGLRTSGWDCVYANDVDRRKQSIHATLFGPCSHYHLGDVGETDEVLDRIPGSPFLATASFPCVDLSVAGHYRGFDGTESSTFFAFAEVLRRLGERRPPLVMLENVVGFLSARGGADFEAALLALTRLGYRLDAFVVDAAHFVPQSRPRVFVVGLAPHLRPEIAGERGPSVLRPLSLLRFREIPQLRAAWTTLPVTPPGPRSVALEDLVDLDEAQPWWDESQVRRHHGMMSELHRRRVDQLMDGGQSFVGTVFRRWRAVFGRRGAAAGGKSSSQSTRGDCGCAG
jgi:DNA (cytosine-5)-methyltransferase 1